MDESYDQSFFVSSCNVFLFSAGLEDSEENLFVSSCIPNSLQSLVSFVIVYGHLEVALEVSVLQDGVNEFVLIDVSNLQLGLGDNGHLHVGRGGGSIFILLVGEDIDADNGGFGRAMLSGFGGGVLGDLAGVALEHAVASLFDATSGGGGAVGRSSLCLLEFLVVRHLLKQNYYVGSKSILL